METATAKYEIVTIMRGVLVKVPSKGGDMTRVEEHSLSSEGQAIQIPPHYRRGLIVAPFRHDNAGKMVPGSGIILNCHYYGIEDGDLGRNITADVEVVNKMLPDGRSFLSLNLRKVERTKNDGKRRVLKIFAKNDLLAALAAGTMREDDFHFPVLDGRGIPVGLVRFTDRKPRARHTAPIATTGA